MPALVIFAIGAATGAYGAVKFGDVAQETTRSLANVAIAGGVGVAA